MSNQLSISSMSVRQFNQLYSLNDLHIASGADKKHQPSLFLRNSQTKDLIAEIERSTDLQNAVITKRGGDFQGTFGCKEIVYAYAMWISPSFMLKVIRAYDEMFGSYLPNTITTEQKYQIRKAVNERVHRTGEKHQAIYHKLYDQFKINSYESLPASKFDEAIDFLGGINARSGLSDNDLYKLARLFVMADRMHSKIADITPALEKMFSKYADSFHSMAFHYTRELKEAKQIIQRETSHINTSGYLDDWNRVLPVIRH